MTLAHKTPYNKLRSRQQGFTLLEVIITMAIISVLLGSATLFFIGANDKRVEKLSQDTQKLARKTMRDAKDEKRAYSMVISGEAIWVEPELIEAQEESLRLGELEVPEEITISYLLDEEDGWNRIETNDTPFVWTFSQTGLCEPLTLRFESESAVDEVSFHPLTAGKLINED